MPLSPGLRIGPHEIVSAIGAGGMGEVYRARDTRLGRDVAIKILPEAFARDPERLMRFEREARTLASLNHPNIAHIHGLEESGALPALVMELVDGPTLADLIDRAPTGMLIDEVLPIARQITHALDAAHEHGIIHRDLKPANIKVRADGTVKVLDFGLAKALDPPSPSDPAEAATITSPALTRAGVVLGTAAYMSPEVAKGRPADKRSDVWGFGCVLFEMLAGTRAFDGDTTAEALGAVVRLEPNWRALPDRVPASVVSLLKRCLQKDPNLRMRDIADVRFTIDDASAAPEPSTHRTYPAWRGFLGWGVAAAVGVVAVAAMMRPRSPVTAESPEVRFTIETPAASGALPSFAVSPDGRSLVFTAQDGDRQRLWFRPLHADGARAWPGTESGLYPFWSPDSRSVGFFADEQLKRIDVANGFVRTVTSAQNFRHGAWSPDGTILFGASVGPLYRISADGGEVREATQLLPGQTNHRLPQFLPDGRRFLLYTLGTSAVRGIYVGSLDSPTVRRVFDRDSAYALLPPGHLLIVREGALWARQLNVDDLSSTGDLVAVAPRAYVAPTLTGFGALSASAAGNIAYRASGPKRRLTWMDRAGNTVSELGQPDDVARDFRLSRDGLALVLSRAVKGTTDLWIMDTRRSVSRPLTFGPSVDGGGIFSPDGRQIAYVSDATADIWEIFVRPANGTGRETRVLESKENAETQDWSPDGRFILYSIQNPQTDNDLWALPLEGARTPVPIARTSFVENEARFSPNGRWIAFRSTESGRPEVYLQPFPGPGPKAQLSTGGGSSPRWRRDGKELFYAALDNRLMAVSITAGDSKVEATVPRSLFTLPASSVNFEPSADGQRFLVGVEISDAHPISVILNWKPPQR